MVGYDPLDRRQLSKYEYAFAGAASGVLTRAISQPLDVLKIRFQLQLEPIGKRQKESKYKAVWQAIHTIHAEERTRALWKGHVPAQLLSVAYGVSQFVSFEIFTRQAWSILPEAVFTEWRSTVHFICGGTSGCFASCLCHPFDTIRTRLVGQGEPKVYNGVVDAVRTMCRVEGIGSLYRGLTPTLVQIVPHAGLQFGFYAFFKNVWQNFPEPISQHVGWTKSMLCGSFAGLAAKTTVYPLDIIKKRLQVQGFEMARRPFGQVGIYSGLIDCFAKIVRHEGLRGLFKGFVPSLLKAAVVSGCSFCFYDQICDALRKIDSTGVS